MPPQQNEQHKIRIALHEGSPSNVTAWEALAIANGNLLQSTVYDQAYSRFKEVPLYIEIWKEDFLAGGVKLFYFSTDKIPYLTAPLSKSLVQFGEFLLAADNNEESQVIDQIKWAVTELIKNRKIVRMSSKGYYQRPDLIYSHPMAKPYFRKEFIITCIDLTLEEQILWQRMHKHHQQEIRRAVRFDLTFVKEDNLAAFMELFSLTYQNQDIAGPDMNFIAHLYNTLKKTGNVNLFFVKSGNEYLSGTLSTEYGKVADYSFSGTSKNNLGAGVLMQWEIMKYYKTRGFEKYYLGQIAKGIDNGNVKFSRNISWFKTEFDPDKTESFSEKYVFNQTYFMIWKLLKKLRNIRHRS